MGNKAKEKNANIELLRMISMFMVVVLHALGKTNLLADLYQERTVNACIAWILEALSISAVNIFILISGYFLVNSEFKIRRLITLICQVMFYSLLSLIICLAIGIEGKENVNVYYLLQTIFPIHMDIFWFMTAYIVIYMLQPVISAGIRQLDRNTFKKVLLLLVIYECLFKSLLPFRFEGDGKGYNVLWFLIVFMVGAYFRLYGFTHLNSSFTGLLLYLVASGLVFAEKFVLDFMEGKLGRLHEINDMPTEYNNLFVFLAAIGIFAAFISMKPMNRIISKVVCALSPMALGVYLCHENIPLRYRWQEWFGLNGINNVNPTLFLLIILASALSVYCVGTIIDYLRIKIFACFERLLGGRKNG